MSLDLQLNKCCHLCEKIPTYHSELRDKSLNASGFYFHNINELVQSAKKGCHVCNLILAELSESQIRDLQEELEDNPQRGTQQLYIGPDGIGGVVLSHCIPGPPALMLTLVEMPMYDLHGGYFISSKGMLGRLIWTISAWREFGPPTWNTGSPEILQTIREWIEDCVCQHSDYCTIHRARVSRLPTRLLHIQNSGGIFHVNLCLGSEIGLYTSYATLSHVWGSGAPVKLLRRNEPEFKQGIPFVTLPPTFADVFQLTDALGLSYLWIDSLCIIQDNLLDWEAESTAMCDVYRASTINIAASASVDCKGGLFRQRNPLSVTPCVFRKSGNYCALACKSTETTPIAREPLSGRAWAVQERLLAPRTVHFTTNSVYFECHSRFASDIDPLYHYFARNFPLDVGYNWAADAWLVGLRGELNKDSLFVRWMKVVEMFSVAQLTHESDKLIAISGLAQFFQSLWHNHNITYVAGLWSLDLGNWLTWRTKFSSRNSQRRPRNACAPSWSWASVNGPIKWPTHEHWRYNSKIYIVEARTVPPNNPFSSVQRGYIRLRGRMCTTKGNREFAAFLDYGGILRYDGDQGANTMENAEGLFMLLTLQGRKLSDATEALILESFGGQRGQYQRIGYFSTSLPSCKAKLESFFYEPSKLAQHLYLDVNEDNEYTIDIV